MLSAPQDNYLASRNQALHEVESAIRDIGGIFQQLAHMVRIVSNTTSLFLKQHTAQLIAKPSERTSHESSLLSVNNMLTAGACACKFQWSACDLTCLVHPLLL